MCTLAGGYDKNNACTHVQQHPHDMLVWENALSFWLRTKTGAQLLELDTIHLGISKQVPKSMLPLGRKNMANQAQKRARRKSRFLSLIKVIFSRLSVTPRQKWLSPPRKHSLRAFRIRKQIEKRIKTRIARSKSVSTRARARENCGHELNLAARVLILFSICLQILKALTKCFREGEHHFYRSATESLEKTVSSSKIMVSSALRWSVILLFFFV